MINIMKICCINNSKSKIYLYIKKSKYILLPYEDDPTLELIYSRDQKSKIGKILILKILLGFHYYFG